MNISKFEFFTSLYFTWILATVMTEIRVLDLLGVSVNQFYEKVYQINIYSTIDVIIDILFLMYWFLRVVPTLVRKILD